MSNVDAETSHEDHFLIGPEHSYREIACPGGAKMEGDDKNTAPNCCGKKSLKLDQE